MRRGMGERLERRMLKSVCNIGVCLRFFAVVCRPGEISNLVGLKQEMPTSKESLVDRFRCRGERICTFDPLLPKQAVFTVK